MHYVIADPHGEYGRFLRMLTEIAFSAEDTLYIPVSFYHLTRATIYSVSASLLARITDIKNTQ